MKNKLQIITVGLFLPLLLFINLFAFSCKDNLNTSSVEYREGFSVHYIDVGEGDCIFAHFPDGKNLLIDCGPNNKNALENITNVLSTYSVKRIDYLVLTHPDSDHVGNADYIISEYSIGKAFLPDIDFTDYKLLNNVDIKLKEKGTEKDVSCYLKTFSGEDYLALFLSPYPKEIDDSVYNKFDKSVPTLADENDLSPIIYLSYKGVSFLFTGDAGFSQEDVVMDNDKVNLYKIFLRREDFSINNIDFLKVSHHGSNENTSKDFLEYINPKNAIISSGNTNYNHPSSELLRKIDDACPDCTLLRTDTFGTISIFVDANGKTEIKGVA